MPARVREDNHLSGRHARILFFGVTHVLKAGQDLPGLMLQKLLRWSGSSSSSQNHNLPGRTVLLLPGVEDGARTRNFLGADPVPERCAANRFLLGIRGFKEAFGISNTCSALNTACAVVSPRRTTYTVDHHDPYRRPHGLQCANQFRLRSIPGSGLTGNFTLCVQYRLAPHAPCAWSAELN